MIRKVLASLFLGVLSAGPAFAAEADSLVEARRAGLIGERFDGYLGIAAGAGPAVERQVRAVNIRRRSLYTDLAVRRRVTPSFAGIAAGCELLSRVAVGEAYLLSEGGWRKRREGDPPPRPEHCGER